MSDQLSRHHHAAPGTGPGVPTIMFLDLTAFTALNDTHGDDAAIAIIDLFVAAVRDAVVGRGRMVKTLGDGVLLQLSEPEDAAEVAHAVSVRLHDQDRTPELTGGATTGPVVERDGDVLGATVNLASRLAGLAKAGELLMTDPPARAASTGGWSVEPLGLTPVRGLREPVSIHRVMLCEPDRCVVDPICGMRIIPGPSTPTTVIDARQVWFCSTTCRLRLAIDPQRDPAEP